MSNKSSGVATDIFKAQKANFVQVIRKKVSATNNGSKFYNFNRSSLKEDAPCSISFKINESLSLDSSLEI